ncbi:MAG: MFS transporter [Pseudomonadota bacterium]
MQPSAGIERHAGSPTQETADGFIAAIVFLGFAQATVGQFVAHGVPLFLRDAGQPSHIIGLVYIASIPYILKVLWAPLIDRYGLSRIGHFRSWVIGGQIGAFVLLLVLATGDPAETPYQLIATVMLLMIAMATQEASVSGLMVKKLAPQDRARGSAYRAAGSALAGAIVGAGALYLLADFGWAVVATTLAMGVGLSVFIVMLLPFDRGDPPPAIPPTFISQFTLFKDRRARRLLVVKIFVGMGVALTYGLKSIVLIDAGYSVANAALISLVLGGAVAFASVLVVRPFVERFGAYSVLAVVGFGVAIFCSAFALLFTSKLSMANAAVFVLVANALTFAAYPASRALLMGYCGKERAATDFAAFGSAEGVFLLAVAGIGATLADQLGFSNLLAVAAVGSTLGALLAWRSRQADEAL